MWGCSEVEEITDTQQPSLAFFQTLLHRLRAKIMEQKETIETFSCMVDEIFTNVNDILEQFYDVNQRKFRAGVHNDLRKQIVQQLRANKKISHVNNCLKEEINKFENVQQYFDTIAQWLISLESKPMEWNIKGQFINKLKQSNKHLPSSLDAFFENVSVALFAQNATDLRSLLVKLDALQSVNSMQNVLTKLESLKKFVLKAHTITKPSSTISSNYHLISASEVAKFLSAPISIFNNFKFFQLKYTGF